MPRWLWPVLIAGAAGMTVILALIPTVGHDQLWLLLAAERMLAAHTANPYGPTVFESNPPLAIWLSALVVKLAGVLELPLTVAFKLMAGLLAAVVGVVCGRLLRRCPELAGAERQSLVFVFVLVFGALPVRDFGQRDYVLALLVLPYLVGAALALAGRALPVWARVVVTAVAALGIALKPHQALLAVAVEVTVMVYPRRLRRRAVPHVLEPVIFVAAAAGYYAAIRTFAPTYLTEILPILRETYWAFGRLSLAELLGKAILPEVLGLIGLVWFGFRMRLPPIAPVLLSAGVGAWLAYLAQGTGWYYQQLPAISFFALAIAFQAIGVTRRRRMDLPRWLPVAAAGVMVLALALATYFSHFERTPQGIRQAQPTPDPSLFAGLAPGTAVATLTTSVDDTVEPAFLYRLTLAQRYPHLWMLPAILRNESGPKPRHVIPPARLAELAALQRRFMVEDLARWRPRVILVARCQDPAVHCQALEDRHDDLLGFFLADPAFRAVFSRYRYVRSGGMYDEYARVD